jgi:[ribosomal protein S18]-alanine N-acetyltransferase
MSDLPLRIRSLHGRDWNALFEIDQICFPADIAFSRGEFAFYLNHPKSIARVAEGSGRILGFVLARVGQRSIAHVLTLDVIPEVRQHQIGTKLMEALHRELKKRGIGVCVLEVAIGNLAAQRLYEKLKYRYLETLIGYYRGREDAYRMVRVVGR